MRKFLMELTLIIWSMTTCIMYMEAIATTTGLLQ